MPFPIPDDEVSRLAALRSLSIVDSPAESLYDDVVKLASAICGMPIAFISFIEEDRQWGKAVLGLDSIDASREASFCARTIMHEVLVVPDTHRHPEFADNPFVVDDPGLRFYAGATIHSDDGHALGTVCVADRRPHTLEADKVDALRVLARQAAALLQLRKQSSELASANRVLHRMAIEDSLTGLANRVLLRDRLDHALGHKRRYGGHLGILAGDLDRFKAVNDTLGHGAGDRLLRTVAERLSAAVRDVDTVARCGGDEFVLVCPGLSDPADLEALAARLTEAVAQPVLIEGQEVTPRLSIGGVLAEVGDDADTALMRADEAMYRVKRLQVA